MGWKKATRNPRYEIPNNPIDLIVTETSTIARPWQLGLRTDVGGLLPRLFFRILKVWWVYSAISTQRFDPSWHLTPRDIAVDNIEQSLILRINIKGSKTDQTKMGLDLYIGKTGNEICPVAAILAYIALSGQDDGPLFRLHDGHCCQDKSLFRDHCQPFRRPTLTVRGMQVTR